MRKYLSVVHKKGGDEMEIPFPKEVKRSDLEHFYTTIDIFTEEKTDIKTAQTIINALKKVSKLEWLQLDMGNSIRVRCKLNEWGSNHNKKIKKDFRDKVKDTVIQLMKKGGVDSFRLSMYRCKVCTSEITDKIHMDVKRTR